VSVLASALPGVRDLRTPATVGYLWLLFGWLLFDHVSRRDPYGDVVESLRSLGDAMGPVAAGIAVAVGAYLVGAVSQEATGLVFGIVRHPLDDEKARLRRKVDELFERATAAVSDLPESEQALPMAEIDSRHKAALKDTADDLALPATVLVGAQEALFGEVDRLRAEGDFRTALSLPLLALTALLVVMTDDVAWAVTVVGIAVLAFQGVRRMNQSERLIAQAMVAGTVESPTLERERQWVDTFIAHELP
jgi:hypothetical protein